MAFTSVAGAERRAAAVDAQPLAAGRRRGSRESTRAAAAAFVCAVQGRWKCSPVTIGGGSGLGFAANCCKVRLLGYGDVKRTLTG